eukprot:TRINITY_DN4724_c0_g1_i1.p1 TRINITY_DN4724_c0_g1~~TRINITY_DN4724_c0_g1_i1.p1  ORF type:complete len:528 (+),score=136.31 TRINITY_DN4724_c0_g1_i1:1889-3472(+)
MNNVFDGNMADYHGGAVFYTTDIADIDGLGDNEYIDNFASAGGAAYISDDNGGSPHKQDQCGKKECKGNDASIYGDDFASDATNLHLDSSSIQDKTLINLDTISTRVTVVDAFGTTVSESEVVIRPHIEPNGAALVGASVATTKNGEAHFEFSGVAQFGQDVTIVYIDQSGVLDSYNHKLTTQTHCHDGEVTVDYPPGSNAFEVCVEGSTQEATTTLKVFWIVTGIFIGLLILACLACIVVLPFFNNWLRKRLESSTPFQFELITMWPMLIGVITGCVAVLIQIPDPTDGICGALPWMWAIACWLVVGALVGQVVWMTFCPPTSISRVNPLYFIIFMCIYGLLNAIVLIVWTALDTLELGYVQDDADLTKECQGDNALVYIGVLIGINGLFLLFGVVLTFAGELGRFRSKKWSSHVQNLGMAVSHVSLVATAIVVLMFVEYGDPSARYIIQACGYLLIGWVLLLLIFFVPFYTIVSSNEDTLNSTMGACSTYSGTGGKSSSSSATSGRPGTIAPNVTSYEMGESTYE